MSDLLKRQGAGRGPGGPSDSNTATGTDSSVAAAAPTSSSTSTAPTSTSSTTPVAAAPTSSSSTPTSTTTPPVSSSSSSSSSTPLAPASNSSSNSATSSSSTSSSQAVSQSVSVIIETQIVTDSLGQTSTILSSSTSTTFITPSGDANTRTSTSTSRTGPIVGGVVGGIAALVILILAVWYVLRRRKRFDFDGNFDPDVVVSGQRPASLGAGGAGGLLAGGGLAGPEGAEVTPYAYNPEFDAPLGGGPGNGMRQFGDGSAAFLTVPGALGAGAAAGYVAGRNDGGTGRFSNENYDPNGPGGAPYTNAPYPPLPYPGAQPGQAYAYGASPYPNDGSPEVGSKFPGGPGTGEVFNRGGREPSPGHSLPPSPSSNSQSPRAPSVSLTHSSQGSHAALNAGVAGAGLIGTAGMSPKEREAYAARQARERAYHPPPSVYAQSNAGANITRPHSRNSASHEDSGSVSSPSVYSQPQSGYGGAQSQFSNSTNFNPQYYNHNFPTAAGVLSVANPSDPERENNFGGGSGVVVHQDGGRVPVQRQMDEGMDEPAEIPPTYDSIPADDRQ